MINVQLFSANKPASVKFRGILTFKILMEGNTVLNVSFTLNNFKIWQ